MQINQAGLGIIKEFEHCKLTSYHDMVGVLTIGWGHTGSDVYEDQVISQDQADALLMSDIITFETGVSACVTVTISNNQFSALCSFSYNEGLGHLESSTLLRLLNSGDTNGAAQQFLVWDIAGGQVVDGLLRRRTAEQALFLTPDGQNPGTIDPDDVNVNLNDIEQEASS